MGWAQLSLWDGDGRSACGRGAQPVGWAQLSLWEGAQPVGWAQLSLWEGRSACGMGMGARPVGWALSLWDGRSACGMGAAQPVGWALSLWDGRKLSAGILLKNKHSLIAGILSIINTASAHAHLFNEHSLCASVPAK